MKFYYRHLLAQHQNISTSDDSYEQKKQISKELSEFILNQISKSQNPIDCNNRRILICTMGPACGFGCQMHHLFFCFIDGYFQNRTVLLDDSGFRYNIGSYEEYFMPLSDTCKFENGTTDIKY